MNTNIGIWSISYPDFKIIYISKEIEKIYGYSLEEFYNDNDLWMKCIYFNDREQMKSNITHLLKFGRISNERRIINKEGELIWVLDNSILIYENEKPVRIEGILKDITKEKKYQTEIRDLEDEKYAILYGLEGIRIEILNLDREILFLNDEVNKIYGNHNVKNKKHCYELAYNREKPCEQCSMDSLINNGKTIKEEKTDIYGNTYLVTSVPIKNDNGEIYIILKIFINIAEQKKSEENLRKAKELAELANQMKSNFLSNMSHEIRTPLNAILGFVSVLIDEESNQEKLEQLNIIKESGQNLKNIINEILDFQKLKLVKWN